jgi:hypothetical protein
VKGQGAFYAKYYYFISTFGCYFELARGKMCCKGIAKLEA